MARAVLFHGPGQPLEVASYPVPEPRGEEVLVRVLGCTLCRSDLHTHAGRRIEPTPTILGHEILGRIEAFGPDAVRRDAAGRICTIGDRITWAIAVGCGRCYFCADDLPQKCERPYKYGHERLTPEVPWGGGLADFVVLRPRTAWFRVCDAVSDAVATPANCATATVAGLLRLAGPVAGRSILVLGAGMLGITACAMARAAGAHTVIASDAVAACRQRSPQFGATHSCSAEPTELVSCVAEATEGRGVDVAFELAGTTMTVKAALSSVRIGGTVVLAGTVAPVGETAIDPEKIVRRMLTIRGGHNYHPRDLAAALEFLAGPGRMFPFETLIAGEYSLEQIDRAFAAAHANPGRRILVRP